MDGVIGNRKYERWQQLLRQLRRRLYASDDRSRTSQSGEKLKTLAEENAQLRQQLTALAADRDALVQQVQERSAVVSALSEIAQALNSTLEFNEVLAGILRQLERVITFDSASIFLVEGDELRIIATRGLPPPDGDYAIPIAEHPLARRVVESDEPVIITDISDGEDVIGSRHFEIRSWIGTSLRVGERRVGVLTIDNHQRNAYSAEDGMLIGSFARQAALALHNAQLYAEAQRRAAETTLLLELTRAVGSTLYLPEVLLRAAGAISEAIGASDVLLLLLDDSETQLVPQAGTSTGELTLRSLWPGAAQLSEEPLLATVLHERRARALSCSAVDLPAEWKVRASSIHLHTLLFIPLVFKECPLGIVVAGLDSNAAHSAPSRLALAEGLATSAALAIEHARLFEQARRAAILEERSRLARELHDSVTQALFSITLTAQAASGQVMRNQERAIEQLQRLQLTAQQALSEMRNLLLQLRPVPLRQGGLSQALREHIGRVSVQDGPTISLIISGDERLINGQERGLYRIAQEALSNAIRHANATRIEVELKVMPERLRLEIRDDGCGFNPRDCMEPGRHLGLRCMAERAAEMHGKLILESRPDAGTTVAVDVPLNPYKQSKIGAPIAH